MRKEKSKEKEGKPHEQQPSVCSKLFWQLARLSLVELKDGKSAGFLVFSNFFVIFPRKCPTRPVQSLYHSSSCPKLQP